MEKNKVTVIIPVYNVEKYLEECVDSVINQSYTNLEIIIVDDGSTDLSGELCDDLATKDSRIKVIHKKNGGLSDARNVAIDICTGEYISFVDSDDYVSEYFVEIMLELAIKNNCEISAIYGGEDFWDEEEYRPQLAVDSSDYHCQIMKASKALELMLYQKIATGAPFKLYKKEIFDGIKFPVGYYYEDVATTYKTFEKASCIAVINSKLYAYRKRKDSIIRQKFNDKKLSALKIYREVVDDECINTLGLRNAAISRTFAMVYSVFLQVPSNNKELKKRLWEIIKECRKDVAFNKSELMRKKNRYAAWISFFGMEISYFIGRKFGQKGSMN